MLEQFKQFYVRASVGVLIKCLYEMHGATTKIFITVFTSALNRISAVYALQFLEIRASKTRPVLVSTSLPFLP